MQRYNNLNQKRLKQLKKPAFAKHHLIKMPKKNPAKMLPEIANKVVKARENEDQGDIQFRGRKIELWISLRIIAFLNQAKTIKDLTEVAEGGNNYSIGATVAERILNKKRKISRKQFSTIAELEGIDGFGVDKFNDLVLLLNQRADKRFELSIFDNFLMPNWIVNPYRIAVQDDATWVKLTRSANWRQFWLMEEIGELSERLADEKSSVQARQYMRSAYVDYFSEEEIASYAFALCWYQIDMDNWFSFDAILRKIREYLTSYSHSNYNLELALIKGFPMNLLSAKGISTSDLPVILNFAEQSVTFWVIELLD